MVIKIKKEIKNPKVPKTMNDSEYMPRSQQLARDEKYAASAGKGKGKNKKI